MNVFDYVRVSGAGQVDKDGPIRQALAIKNFCEANHLVSVGSFKDLAVSGTIDGMDRPGLYDMLANVTSSKVEAIIVENLDRLARDLVVSEIIIREIKARGLKLYAVNLGLVDQVTTESEPSRTLIRQILGALAQYEKQSLVLKLRGARERKRRETGRCEGPPAFYESLEGKRLVSLIQELRVAGVSWNGIAIMLRRDGVKKAKGQTNWRSTEVIQFMGHYNRTKDRRK